MSDGRDRAPQLRTRLETSDLPARKRRLLPYVLALCCVGASTLVALFIEPYASLEDEMMIYLLGDILAALRFELKVSVFAAVASVLACDYIFVPPRMAFAWTDAKKTLTFLAMIAASAVISGLSERLRHQEKVATKASIERTELAQAAQRAQLDADAERLRSSLLSAVSHDLKTPLASIIASGTTLLEHQGTLDAGASRGLVSTMVREGERLGKLLQNLLSMSRLESPSIQLRRTPEALEDIVATALSRLNGALALRQVTVDVPADLPYVLAEPALIEQVLLNLLENALRYTPPTSSIEIAAQAGEGVIRLQVSDTGPGIAEAEREKVFQEFFRGSQARKGDGGFGLGLSICRAVVRAHGGKIAIGERPGGGALVELTLPVTPGSNAWLEHPREVTV